MQTTFRGQSIMGIRIPTIFQENDARLCEGCGQRIDGTPFRVSIMDVVSTETAPSWARGASLNPGPHQFHGDPEHVRAWCREQGYLLCRHSGIRELMRPIRVPGPEARWGLCDGLHREAHELVPA
jgi:hypothetical protein